MTTAKTFTLYIPKGTEVMDVAANKGCGRTIELLGDVWIDHAELRGYDHLPVVEYWYEVGGEAYMVAVRDGDGITVTPN